MNLQEHSILFEGEVLERYEFALDLVKDTDIVLDLACGTGYGSYLLSQKTKFVVGADNSSEAISYAVEKYQRDNLLFGFEDISVGLSRASNHFDVVISFETIEHVYEQDFMLSEFYRVLKPGGRLLISTPDRNKISYYGNSNPFHVAELSLPEFTQLLSRYFTIEGWKGQGKFVELPRWKHYLRLLRNIPFLVYVKRAVVKLLGQEKTVHLSLRNTLSGGIGPLVEDSVVIIALCKK